MMRVTLRGAAVPPRVISAHRVGARLERMAAVELEWLVVAVDLARQSREHLDRRGRRLRQQLRNVGASLHAANGNVKRLAKALQQAGSDELRIGRRDLIARAR